MSLRKTLLRIVLWSLAVAAVLGAIAILSGGVSELWRVSFSTVITAVAAALLMPVSKMLDKDESRGAGILGTILVLTAFVLTMMLVWNIAQLFAGPRFRGEEAIGLTLGFVVLCGAPSVALLRFAAFQIMRTTSAIGLLAAAASFVTLMWGTWSEARPMSNDAWATIGTMIGLIGLSIALCVLPANENVDARWLLPLSRLRLVAATAGTAALAIGIYAAWERIHQDNGLFTGLLSLCVVVAHANLCLMIPLTAGQGWVRLTAIGAAAVTAGCVVAMVIMTGDSAVHDQFARLAGAAGVVASCASLALLVLMRINTRIAAPTIQMDAIGELTVLCAGCGRKQALRVGRSSCLACHMVYDIRIQEPQCIQCGYSLYNLTSDKCPECGMATATSIAGAPHFEPRA